MQQPNRVVYTLNFETKQAASYAFYLLQHIYNLPPNAILYTQHPPIIMFGLRELAKHELQRLVSATKPVAFTTDPEGYFCTDCGQCMLGVFYPCACCFEVVCLNCLNLSNSRGKMLSGIDVSCLCGSCRSALRAFPYGPDDTRRTLVTAWKEMQHG